MKVLMISGDPNLMKNGSSVRERHTFHAGVVERLDFFVWPQEHSMKQIFTAAKTQHYDVITAQDPFWRGLLAYIVARRTGARLNLQVHADLKGQSLIRRLLARFLLQRADSVRVVSTRVKEEVAALGTLARITVLPVFVDPHRINAVAPRVHPHFTKTILWIGRFESEKNPLGALTVLQVVREQGVEAGMIMLGSGSLEQRLRKAAHTLPVEFPGWQEPIKYLAMADVVLSTSPFESYGASIVEALAAGVAVVATDVGVAKEAGAIVVPQSELAHAVVDVLQHGTRGVLKLQLPSAAEWAKQWRNSLV